MALKIADTCINCSVCELACPNQAIIEGQVIYEILPNRCTECVGHYDEPQCQALCPIEACITVDESHPETHEQLLSKYHTLQEEETEEDNS